ncbi:hypothetical protein B0A53_06242 [Rhodotorula sp. CCFEE 5036]|nr:hypothetical protein B0A53_06242 [Rhodotorula sp. CCFEE 5036]
MPLRFYDLVTKKRTGVFFSNNCSPVRLALLAKGIDFVTEEVEYPDLRFTWTPVLVKELGVEKATAPFIECEDGKHVMDSLTIALWLDKAYPDRYNLFLPEAELPVDVGSQDYKQAVQNFEKMEDELNDLIAQVDELYGPRIVSQLDAESGRYWVEKNGYGTEEWANLVATQNDPSKVQRIQRTLRKLAEDHLAGDALFLTSATKPGFTDSVMVGINWAARMDKAFPLEDIRARDLQD